MSGAVMHEVPCLAVVIAEHRNQIQHFVVNASGLRHAPAIKGMARATDGGPVESNLGLRTEGMNKIGPQMMPGNNGRVAARRSPHAQDFLRLQTLDLLPQIGDKARPVPPRAV